MKINTKLRGSQRQLNDELSDIYKKMTDPEELKKERIKKIRENKFKEIEKDYGF